MFFAYQYIFICIHVLYNLSIFLFICLLGSIPIVSESNPSAEFDCDVAGGSLHRLRCFVAFSCSWSCQSLRGSTPTRDHMVWHIVIFKIACILAKSNALCGQFMSVHVCSCSVALSDPDPKLVLMRDLAASLHKIWGPHPPVLAQPSEVLQRGSWPLQLGVAYRVAINQWFSHLCIELVHISSHKAYCTWQGRLPGYLAQEVQATNGHKNHHPHFCVTHFVN